MPKQKEPFPRLLGIVEDFISEHIARVDALRPELIYLADSVGSLDLVGAVDRKASCRERV